MRGIGQRLVGAALLAVTASIVGGCQLLYGLGGAYPPFPEPSPGKLATYTTGRATITIGDAPAIVLSELTSGGSGDTELGANATFRNVDGWYLRVMGAAGGQTAVYSPTWVMLDRIDEHQHWATDDPGRCTVKITKADETGLSGTASCTAIRWVDALGGMTPPEYKAPYIENQPAFDAEITFEAAPSTSQTS